MRDRTAYAILNPEGFRVHTCKSRNDAQRVAAKFDREDGVRHTIKAITLRTDRDLSR